jgi:uncharacterized protein YhaN
MPFIIDDILTNCDDPRSQATLKMLADLSRKMQVLFCTHHQHPIALAEKSIPNNILQIQRMNT